jgi:hypothetical protein
MFAHNAANLPGGLPDISLRRQMQGKTLPLESGDEQVGCLSIPACRAVNSSLHTSSPSNKMNTGLADYLNK